MNLTAPATSQAFYLKGCDIQSVEATPKKGGAPMPEALVIPPGDYTVAEHEYALNKEGLYRFINPPVANQQRIVYRQDVVALMSAVCWLVSHGYRDNHKPYEEIKRVACQGKIILSCGPYSQFVVRLFQELGVPIRCVVAKTLYESNGFNDGHILTEVMVDGRWIVFDPDAGATYSHGGKALNIVELVQQIQCGDYQQELLSTTTPVAIGHFTHQEYAFDLWYETMLGSSRLKRETFERPMGLAVIPHRGLLCYTCATADVRRRVEKLHPDNSLQYLSPDEFHQLFYTYPINPQTATERI